MALSGLDIYKLLPKTNCKACGFSTCLAFAMALAQKRTSLDKCPHVTEQARAFLASAGQPPIKLVTIGSGDNKIEIGNETVMYRHEQKFFHPCGIGVVLDDTLTDAQLSARIENINSLAFERVGQTIGVNLIYINNVSGSPDNYLNAVRKTESLSKLNIALSAKDEAVCAEALKICAKRRPLIVCPDTAHVDGFAKIAKENGLPIAVTGSFLDLLAQAADRARNIGVEEIVLNMQGSVAARVQAMTFARRTALKKNYRTLGYPMMTVTEPAEPDKEFAEAVSYIMKYSGIVVVREAARESIFPLLVAREDIYQDPQKPVQVRPGIYEIGKVTGDSPVLVTTNFSITYFTVAGEVEASKVPSYIISCDCEGMSVLTAWAAEKFTAEKISDALKTSGIEERIAHRRVIIPGYVSVLSGKLEETSAWKVEVGPREASGITNFLRSWK